MVATLVDMPSDDNPARRLSDAEPSAWVVRNRPPDALAYSVSATARVRASPSRTLSRACATPRTDPSPAAESLRQFMALGRYGKADDIANAVAFLASAKAQYITGSTLTVDGGANA